MILIQLFYMILLGLFFSVFSGCSNNVTPEETKTTDHYKRYAQVKSDFQWPERKMAAVSLTFDDARPSQVDIGLPILDEWGVKATFYVSPKRLQGRLKGWKRAVSNGHEIGNHTLNHPCSGNFSWSRNNALEDYSWEMIKNEIIKANKAINENLGIDAKTFAYPCGQKFIGRGKKVQSFVPLVAEKFLAGRGWRNENRNDPGYCDLAQLLGTQMDGLDFEQAKKIIEQAKKEGSWLIFAGHEIGLAGGRRRTVRTDTLQAICEYCQDPQNGIWIDTVESISKFIRNQRNNSN